LYSCHPEGTHGSFSIAIEVIPKYVTPVHLESNISKENRHNPYEVIMMLETSNYLKRLESNQFSIFTQKFHNSVSKTIDHFEGHIIKKDNHTYLATFTSVTNAVLCALKIQADFKYITPKFDKDLRKLNMGICAFGPSDVNMATREEAIPVVAGMCELVTDPLVISSEINALYEQENRNARIDRELIRILRPKEERFLARLIDYSEQSWNSTAFNISSFSAVFGYSRSRLYRQLMKLTGKSPGRFIREFRLHKALNLLHAQFGSIGEIARASGFKSPGYFTKCFVKKFGILPSKYVQHYVG